MAHSKAKKSWKLGLPECSQLRFDFTVTTSMPCRHNCSEMNRCFARTAVGECGVHNGEAVLGGCAEALACEDGALEGEEELEIGLAQVQPAEIGLHG
jgi:hypothetical protein